MNTLGRYFRLTTFGESHSPAIGGVIDGFPAGVKIDFDLIQSQLQRRKGIAQVNTTRKESDDPQFLSGIFNGTSTGTPIAFIIPNKEQRSEDYDPLQNVYRPSHADYTYQAKYGIWDHRGGGRASARESVARVVAGSMAYQLLREEGVTIKAFTSQIGDITLKDSYGYAQADTVGRAGCPDPETDEAMYQLLLETRASGDTIGGIATTIVEGVPAGWGSPLYGKLDARLAEAMLGINACKGFEMGSGFGIATLKGVQANDSFRSADGRIEMASNHSGGILGGISTGAPLLFRIVFKPIPSISLPQSTVTTDGTPTTIQVKGRHDASVFPRVLPIIESMTALILIDELLAQRLTR